MSDSETDDKEKGLIVDETNIGQRLDVFLASRMPAHVSRSRVKAIIKAGGVSLDKKPCTNPNQRIQGSETIIMEIPEPEDASPEPQNISLEIHYEDDHLLVVNKPIGMVVHPAAGNADGTLVNALLYHCGESLAGIGGVRRPGIVHRLDKDTSGLMVIAKTQEAHVGLANQFADHGRNGPLERAYQALCWGLFERLTGTVETFLGRSSNNRMKRAVVKETVPGAREAITHFQVVRDFGRSTDGSKDNPASTSLVECRLETGRTHQIRVHLSHIGHPLVGDQDYGKHFQTKQNTLDEQTKNIVRQFNRQALHAAILGFEHPVSGNHLRFEAPMPDDMQNLVTAFETINYTQNTRKE